MLEHVYLIPLIPLAASLLILFGGKERTDSPLPYLGIAAMGWCLIQSLIIFYRFAVGHAPLPYEHNWTWFSFATDVGGRAFAYELPVGVLIDGAASVMLVVVTLISLLVQIYSLGYMRGDPRFKRYYAFLSFFTASMLGLVVSSSLLILFACWELVGVSSYLLIGFWFEKDGPPYAAKKAFITTKLGDMGFYLALLLIFVTVGSFQITQIQTFVERGYMPTDVATWIALGLLVGAIGKSAQFPLSVWLPDAMQGPTPVSALIHAATMVVAGIYLVAKFLFLFAAAPIAMEAVAWTGLITALIAATMAVVAYDIKRVLAFSTISQLGFMMCALGVGGYTAGLFHLTTHAFFKALLFLGAGSVIHGIGTNDMRKMGGLSKQMPATFITMLVATCAIAGLPPLSGYYSKDLILEKVFEHNYLMFALITLAALLTAFYMFRLIFLTFLGEARDPDRHSHAHESPPSMTIPLWILAALSAGAGWFLHHGRFFENLVHYELPEGALLFSANNHADPSLIANSVTAMVVGAIALAWWLYRGPAFAAADRIKARMSFVFKTLENGYGFDAFYLWIVALSDQAARLAYWIDSKIIDAIFIDGWALVVRVSSEMSNLFDALFVDKTVDGFGGISRDIGVGLRSLVSKGLVQEYLMYVAIAVSLFASLVFTR